jgi:hypothetical protein
MEAKDPKKLTREQVQICQTLHEAHINTLTSASQSYDKAILNLSTVTLGFTFAFIEYARNLKALHHLWLLGTTWGLLILAILFILISFIADQIHSSNEINRYQGGDAKDMPCVECIMSKSPKIAGVCFFLAIVSFTFFVWQNISS